MAWNNASLGPAGVTNAYGQNYYKKYESQKLCKKYQSKLGIKIICFKEPYFCKVCKKIVNVCHHQERKKNNISGTKIRNLIISRKKIPNNFMRKQLSETLSYNSIIWIELSYQFLIKVPQTILL